MNIPSESEPDKKSVHRYGALRKTILSSMILVPVIIYVLALGIGYYFFVSSLQNSTMDHMKRILGDHRQMIDRFLAERKGDLAFVLNTYAFEELREQEVLKQILLRLQHKSTAFVDLGVFDTRGLHINYQGPYDLSGKNYRDEEWFTAVMENGFYISDVFLGFRNIPHFIIAMVKHSQTRTWVIRATIDTVFFDTLVRQVSMGRTGETYILNTQGLLQTRPRSGGELMDPKPSDQDHPVYHDGMRVTIQSDQEGNEYLTATTWLKNKLWKLVVRQDRSDALQTLNRTSYLIMMITVIGILIIVLVSFYFTTRIIRRLEAMDSEKEKLRFQLIHASALAELGEMATGFAHEINNPLQIIQNEQALIEMNLSELIETKKTGPSDTRAELTDSLKQIGLQIDRCAMITRSILKFGRRNEPESQAVNLSRLIPEIVSIVDKQASLKNIDIHIEASDRLLPVIADPAQLQQVLLNLFNNAIDAIIEKHGATGGLINITIVDRHPNEIEISISDNGIGISPENLNKIFTPFFTTKPIGKGTGLGLSVCYGIIKNLGGDMVVFNHKDGGTTFKIKLPAEENPIKES